MKSNYLWLIDAGHGGMRNGVYTTAPAKMFTFPDGLVIYEGVVVRAIAKLVWLQLVAQQIDFKLIYDEVEDESLVSRVKRANAIYEKDKRAVVVSIHINATPADSIAKGKCGTGLEVWTSKGESKSDKVATIFCETYAELLPDFKFRKDETDGDPDKESDFYILKYTNCPAVLPENLFMDNRKEAEFLLSIEGQRKIANAIVRSIQNVERLKPI